MPAGGWDGGRFVSTGKDSMAKNHRSDETPLGRWFEDTTARGSAKWSERTSEQHDALSVSERRQRDRDRLLLMQLEGFDGPTWRLVQADTWGYLSDVLPGLIQSGKLLAIRTSLTGADDLELPSDGIDRADAEDLAAELAPGAMAVFHKQLKAGRWDVRREITFNSWVVNLCALRFSRPYVRWLKDRQRLEPGEVPDAEAAKGHAPESVIYVVEFERYLGYVGEAVTKAMIRLDLDGFTDREIGEQTRRTIKSVEYRLAKSRKAATARREREGRRDWPRGTSDGVA